MEIGKPVRSVEFEPVESEPGDNGTSEGTSEESERSSEPTRIDAPAEPAVVPESEPVGV